MKEKNSKKIIIIVSLIFVLLVLFLLTLFISNIVNDKKMSRENMQVIKDNYNQLSDIVSEYNQIRTDLSDKLNNFIYDRYPGEHDAYMELINKYNDNIKNIDKSVNNINSRCDVIYNDISVNKICDSYEVLYEKLINLYVTDINNYNDKIISYNQYKETDSYQKIKLLHEDYIDYNNDKKYEGKDLEDEEDKKEE